MNTSSCRSCIQSSSATLGYRRRPVWAVFGG